MGSWHAHAYLFFMIVNIMVLCQIPCVECASITSTTKSTYNTSDGKTCVKCSPGQYLMQDCINSGEEAKCGPCALGTFQLVENIAKNCTSCTQFCGVYKILDETCDATTDNTCRCSNGSFSFTVGGIDKCQKHSTCPPGEGVKQKGNTNNDTVCEPCAEGTFSNNDSATETCKPCTRCEELGYIDTASCTQKNDTTCGNPTESSAVQLSLIPAVPITVVLFVLVVGVLFGILCWWCRRKPNDDAPNSPPGCNPLDPNGTAGHCAESPNSDSAVIHAHPDAEDSVRQPMLSQPGAHPDAEDSVRQPMLSQPDAHPDAEDSVRQPMLSQPGAHPDAEDSVRQPMLSQPGAHPDAEDSVRQPMLSQPDAHPDAEDSVRQPMLSQPDGETSLKDHFDVCIIYSANDEEDVYEFKEHLEKIDLNNSRHPKISLYTDEIWAAAGYVRRAEFICEHCTLIFVYLSENFISDDYANFFKNQAVMISIKNSNTRPVLSKKDCVIPTALVNAQKIHWYNRDKKSYQQNIVSLFNINITQRLKREAGNMKSDLSPL